MSLTPEERAEKICVDFFGFPIKFANGNDLRLYEDIAAQIREVIKETMEALEDEREQYWKKEGFRACQEKAAKIAENFNHIPVELEDYLPMIAKDIRALSSTEGK